MERYYNRWYVDVFFWNQSSLVEDCLNCAESDANIASKLVCSGYDNTANVQDLSSVFGNAPHK